MIIAGNSHVALFRKRLRDASTGKIVEVKWVGSLTAAHFVHNSSAARSIRSTFGTHTGWKILSIGMHDIFELCRAHAQGGYQKAFDQLAGQYKSIFTACNRNGNFGWLISPQQLDGPGAFGLTEKTVFDIADEFNHVVSEWCQRQGIQVINPLPQILDDNSKPKSDLVQRDGIHLNDRALTLYIHLLEKQTKTEITCEPSAKKRSHRLQVKTETESLSLLVADELGLDWDRSGMPAGQRKTFEKKVIGYITGYLSKKGARYHLHRHTRYNKQSKLSSADLVDIYNYASHFFGGDINFDVNIRVLDTVQKISRFFMDQKVLTKNDFFETLAIDTDDRIRSSETLAADSRIASLDDGQYQSLKEMIHHQTGGEQCQYGVIFFWCALVEMERGNFGFALDLLNNALSPDLGFPFHPSRIKHYRQICSERLKSDRNYANASGEMPDVSEWFYKRSATSFPAEQYADSTVNLLSAWCDQNSGTHEKIEYICAATHKDECQAYFKLFPNLKRLDLFVSVPETIGRLKHRYRHDARIKIHPYILSDRTGYDLVGFEKGNKNGPPYFHETECRIPPLSVFSAETIAIDDFIRDRAAGKPDLMICTIRGLAQRITQSLSPDVQNNLKAVCVAAHSFPRHLHVGRHNIAQRSESNRYVLFGSASASRQDDQYCHALYINPQHANPLFRRHAEFQGLPGQDAASFQLAAVGNRPPQWVVQQADTMVENLFQQGMELLKNNRVQEALSSFSKTIEINPEHPMALLQAGLILRRKNKPQDAIPYLAAAFGISPSDRGIAKAFAETLRDCGLENKAQVICQRYSAQYLQAPSPPKPLLLETSRTNHLSLQNAVGGKQSIMDKPPQVNEAPDNGDLEIDFKKIQKPVVTSQLKQISDQDIEQCLKISKAEREGKINGLISFILPTKNRADGLKEMLSSLSEAMQDLSYEIILYADKESEDIRQCMETYNIQKVFYDHDIFGPHASFSWSALMNHGFSHASGQWIMFGSDDIVLYPHCFKNAMTLLNGRRDENIGGITFLHRNTAETYNGFFKDFGYDTLNGNKPFINFGLINKTAFEKTQGFDEKLRFFWADVDICTQLLSLGYAIIPSHGSLVDHHNWLEKDKKDHRTVLFETDTAYFHSKWYGKPLFAGYNPLEKVRYVADPSASRRLMEGLSRRDLKEEAVGPEQTRCNIVIDGVIFQLQSGKIQGISRVWRNLIPELMRQMPDSHITVLQRDGFPIPMEAVNIHTVPAFRLEGDKKLDADDEMLGQACRDLKADLFITTYYTRAPGVKNMVMVHDLIPEKFQFDLSQPEWVSKQRAIETADAFICVSQTTQNDLVSFYPQIVNRPMIVAHNGLDLCFKKPAEGEITRIRRKLKLERPYVMLVGNRYGYKNGIKMLAALSQIQDKERQLVLCVGGEHPSTSAEIDPKKKLDIRYAGQLNDRDLVAAYGGALALMAPSQYEGFGLPVIEAMACGCPVIAYGSKAVSEIGGDAVYYADLSSPVEICEALNIIKKKSQSHAYIQKGYYQAKKYNWPATSQTISGFIEALINKPSILLTAIVSTYNAAEFIQGCLEDLVHQTIADRLEIIVVDSASQEDEAAIVRGFQRQHANIKYIRTTDRESVYQAWNRGIKFALGKYVSNANTDDRHRQDAFEQMVHVLEQDENIALVYADVIKTRTANETFRHCTPTGMFHWHDWNRRSLLEKGCFIGPQPVWRKAVHQEYGYFDDNYAVSADFEFWLRISQTNEFYHISKPLGLYMDRTDSIEHANAQKKRQEDQTIIQRYRVAANDNVLIGRSSGSDQNLKSDCRQTQTDVAQTSSESFTQNKSTNEETMQGGNAMHSQETILKAIEHLVDGGHKEAALWVMAKLVADFPQSAQLHSEMAGLAYEQADKHNALAHFKQAADLEPGNTRYLKDLGDYYYVVEKDAEGALAQYERVLSVDPNNIDILIMAGHLSVSLHRYAQGQQFYQQALNLDPHNSEVRRYLEKMNHPVLDQNSGAMSVDDLYAAAQTKVQDADHETAISLLEQLLAQDDTHALAHNDLGVLYYENGNLQAALTHYEKAAALQPENETLQKNLADFYLAAMGDHEKAMRAYVQVLKLNPRDVEAILSCGQICISLGQGEDARDLINTALETEPWNENAQCMLQQLEQVPESAVSTGTDLHERAKVKAAKGDLHGAIDNLNQYVAGAPDNANAHNDLGVLYFDVGDKNKALAFYEQAVRLDPTDHTYRKNLADFYLIEQGRAEEAMKLYLGVLEENPQDIESLIASGMLCVSLGQREDAKIFYKRVIEIEPWNEIAQSALNDLDPDGNRGQTEGVPSVAAG